jgi:hypothetical protein
MCQTEEKQAVLEKKVSTIENFLETRLVLSMPNVAHF